MRAAEAVTQHGGPTFTPELSAAETLVLLARRALRPAKSYEVPQIMGPLQDGPAAGAWPDVAPEALAMPVIAAADGCGYLPHVLRVDGCEVTLAQALMLLACHALAKPPARVDPDRLCTAAIPGVAEATEKVRGYANWRCHGPQYHQPGIVEPFIRQCWTLKPAYTAGEYGPGVELGRHVNPMFDRR